MSRNRFVTTDIVRLDLSEGDWVEVKAWLSYAEDERLRSAAIMPTQNARGIANVDDQQIALDLPRWRMARLELYLTDWSFRGADDRPVAVTASAIANLHPDTAAEIHEALDVYLERRDAEKKVSPG